MGVSNELSLLAGIKLQEKRENASGNHAPVSEYLNICFRDSSLPWWPQFRVSPNCGHLKAYWFLRPGIGDLGTEAGRPLSWVSSVPGVPLKLVGWTADDTYMFSVLGTLFRLIL